MSARSRAVPWFGERKMPGPFCARTPVGPEVRAIAADPGGLRTHGEAQEWMNAEMTKIVMGSTLTSEVRPGSYDAAEVCQACAAERQTIYRAAFVLHFMKQQALESWARLMMAYGMPDLEPHRGRKIIEHPPFGQGKHRGPKWGQPGRGRRRKARRAARAKQEALQRTVRLRREYGPGRLPIMAAK